MRKNLACYVWITSVLVLAGGCSTTSRREGGGGDAGAGAEAGNAGSGNTTGSGSGGAVGSDGAGPGGSDGAGPGGSDGAGPGGSTGSGGALGSGGIGGSFGSGGGPSECPTDPNLVTHNGWVGCDATISEDNPMGLQGAFYGYGDGVSCVDSPNPCGPSGCCIIGATIYDPYFEAWGCGLGFELNATGGGVSSVKQPYVGPANCFEITIAGNSGGSPVRIGYTYSDQMEGKVGPFIEIGPLLGTWSGSVCFDEVRCPIGWVPPPQCAVGAQYDLQIQVVGGLYDAPFDLCLQRLIATE